MCRSLRLEQQSKEMRSASLTLKHSKHQLSPLRRCHPPCQGPLPHRATEAAESPRREECARAGPRPGTAQTPASEEVRKATLKLLARTERRQQPPDTPRRPAGAVPRSSLPHVLATALSVSA